MYENVLRKANSTEKKRKFAASYDQILILFIYDELENTAMLQKNKCDHMYNDVNWQELRMLRALGIPKNQNKNRTSLMDTIAYCKFKNVRKPS